MSDPQTTLHPRGDQPLIATKSVLGDRKELAFVALERTRMPIVISDPKLPDNPIVLANSAFLHQTGYTANEVIGRNCLFLQGPGTDPASVDAIREAVRAERPLTIELLNYRKDSTSFWNQLHISPVHDDEGELSYFFASQMDVTVARRASDLMEAEHSLLLEVDHRAKNALALVQGILRLSARNNGTDAYAAAVLGRVDAIALAHVLLSEARWRSVPIAELLAALLTGVTGQRVAIAGPPVLLSAAQVQPLAIVLHELLTNVAKHGALATPAGTCRINWQVDSGRVVIDVTELGGSEPEAGRVGFGRKIIEQVVQRQLRGEIVSEWRKDGLVTSVLVPIHA